MAFVYLDDKFPEHPKVLPITDAAFRLWFIGLCYSNRNLTDGRVPPEVVARRTTAAIGLVKADLWELNPAGGWNVHDYLDWQKSADRVRSDRARAAEKKRLQRAQPPL